MVKLKRDYNCAPEGHTTYKFKKGDDVEGKVAEMAIADGAADKRGRKPVAPPETKPSEPEETKADE